jgi:predicted amidohydrolase
MSSFKIAAAQVASIRGDLIGNIRTHVDAITAAASHEVSVLVFPELSLMGYEIELAEDLQLNSDDPRLAPIGQLAQRNRMQIVTGASIMSGQSKPYLGAFVFGVDGSIRTYAKMHLGGGEPSCFAPGDKLMSIASHGQSIGLSICADSSKPTHPAAYASNGAAVYAASVFLNAEWYATDCPRFARYAVDFGMLVLMANHAASIGTLASVGNSAAWAPDGSLIACATGTDSALVVVTRTARTWIGEVVAL